MVFLGEAESMSCFGLLDSMQMIKELMNLGGDSTGSNGLIQS